MKRCSVCGQFNVTHPHIVKKLLKLFGLKAVFKIKRAKAKETKPIVQQPIKTLPLFSEEKNVQ
jgi:hypothetical protein